MFSPPIKNTDCDWIKEINLLLPAVGVHDMATACRIDSPIQTVFHKQRIEFFKVFDALLSTFGQYSRASLFNKSKVKLNQAFIIGSSFGLWAIALSIIPLDIAAQNHGWHINRNILIFLAQYASIASLWSI